jgi:hypothetical protein
MQRILWLVGTLAMSLTLAGSAAGAARADGSGDAVVLVHGWHGAGSTDTLASSSLAPIGQRLRANGLEPIWAAGVAVDPDDTLFDSADRLADIVAAAARRQPGRPVRIVAHSYGGLVARALLESDRYTKLRAQSFEVSHLVTMGTPMGGVDLWLPLLFVLGDPLGEPSVWELTPAWMGEFNRTHRPPPGTRYTIVAGDARSQVPPLWLLPASDGAITVASALALPERSLGITERLTEDVHSATDYTRFFGWRALVDNETTFRRFLLPGLTTFAATPSAAGSAPDMRAGPPQAATGSSHTPVREQLLAPGESLTLAAAGSPVTAWLLLANPAVAVQPQSGPVPDGSPAADLAYRAGAAIPGVRDGAVGRVLPVAGTSGLVVTNSGPRTERVAWLGLLPADRYPLSITARATGGRLSVRLDTPGPDMAKVRMTVLGPDGLRSPPVEPSRLDGRGSHGTLGGNVQVTGGVHYVQVTAEVDGVPVQTETTVWVPGAALEPDTR